MQVHVLQVAYDDAEPVAARIERVADLVRAQRGADLVVLPELWSAGGFCYRSWPERAEALHGPTVEAIGSAAREIDAVVHAGSIMERGKVGYEGRNLWNTSVLLDGQGHVLDVYRKIHRFGVGDGEPLLLEAGDRLVTAEISSRDSRERVVLGLATCYDLRFPEMFRFLVERGAEMFVVPAAWPQARVQHWTLLARARAVEDQCFVVACNTAGTHARTPMGAHSLVVDPRGEVLAEAGEGEEVLVVPVDVAQVAQAREQFPVLADRRLRGREPGRW